MKLILLIVFILWAIMINFKVYQIILLLTPFVFSFAFGLDIYIPIIPQMSQIFDTTPAVVHLTLSLFLSVTGLGQLFIGPLSDRYGRKIIFYLASFLYILGSLLCVVAPHIAWLIVGRLICALGACGMLVTSFALIRDLYSQEESAKMYSYLNGAIGISPTFAPIIGGYLSVYFGWQSIFIFLAFIGLCTLYVTWAFIEETHEKKKRVLLDREIFHRYWKIFTHTQFLIYTLIAGLAEGVFFCFFSISPFIIIDLLGVETQNFGYYFAVFGAVIAFGGLLSGKLIEYRGIQSTIRIGISLMLLGGACMLAWDYFIGLTFFGFLFPMALACTGAIFVIGACASKALEPFAAIAGTAAAALGALEFSIASIIGAMLMLFPVSSTAPYGTIIVISGLFCGILYKYRPNRLEFGLEKSHT